MLPIKRIYYSLNTDNAHFKTNASTAWRTTFGDKRNFAKRSEATFGRGTSRVPNLLSRVMRGFILASLLFYQLRAKMKAQRSLELQKLFI